MANQDSPKQPQTSPERTFRSYEEYKKEFYKTEEPAEIDDETEDSSFSFAKNLAKDAVRKALAPVGH
jgi:hypothetical protein